MQVEIIGNLLTEWLSNDSFVPLALVVIVIYLLMSSYLRKQRARSGSAQSSLSQVERPSTTSGRADIRRDIDALLVELQELSRRISAEIDVRFAKLEVAMRDADRRIAALNRLAHQGETQTAEPETKNTDEGQDIRHAIVYELADQGYSSVEIAKDLGKTPGEVELILNLRRPLDAADDSDET